MKIWAKLGGRWLGWCPFGGLEPIKRAVGEKRTTRGRGGERERDRGSDGKRERRGKVRFDATTGDDSSGKLSQLGRFKMPFTNPRMPTKEKVSSQALRICRFPALWISSSPNGMRNPLSRGFATNEWRRLGRIRKGSAVG